VVNKFIHINHSPLTTHHPPLTTHHSLKQDVRVRVVPLSDLFFGNLRDLSTTIWPSSVLLDGVAFEADAGAGPSKLTPLILKPEAVDRGT